jgi:hypothetical protein
LFISFAIKPEKTCTNYPAMSVASPDGKFSAEQWQETCNYEKQAFATVRLTKNETFSLGGNKDWVVFRAPAARVVSKQPDVYEPLQLQLSWLSKTVLQISYPRGALISTTQGDFNGVTVNYREIPSNDR